MKKRILAITWMMPPLVFPRSLQISRLFAALAERGWDILAISVPPDLEKENGATLDHELARIYGGYYSLDYVEPREEIQGSPLWIKFFRALARKKENVLHSNWIDRATDRAIYWIKKENPDLLISFGQPWVNHLVACKIKNKIPKLPWIAHFSDPWVDNPYNATQEKFQKNEAIKQEEKIVRGADRLIFTNRKTADVVLSKYPVEMREKMSIVSHSVEEKFKIKTVAIKNRKLNIVHSGNLYEGRESFALLDAVQELIKEKKICKIQIEFIGYSSKRFYDEVKNKNLFKYIKLSPPQPFMPNLARCSRADLLLVIDASFSTNMFLPSKVFDYLGLGKPIIGLTPKKGATGNLFKVLNLPTADPSNKKEILILLKKCLKKWEQGHMPSSLPKRKTTQKFGSKKISIKWIHEFKKTLLQGN